ncbi:hypothetical protein PROFUN_13288 [Planoprotostelium fungivorum]|uniref:Cleavage and polyadenylation specificity factor subunit 5 n=1 Tax=Planoprotostelium fungivorum TaxID=1890364 RepID=A0A2P6N4P1_9EUKA|nr:hypothetical protein PROFUN_13288 [Planoprotostelium fungivorum]
MDQPETTDTAVKIEDVLVSEANDGMEEEIEEEVEEEEEEDFNIVLNMPKEIEEEVEEEEEEDFNIVLNMPSKEQSSTASATDSTKSTTTGTEASIAFTDSLISRAVGPTINIYALEGYSFGSKDAITTTKERKSTLEIRRRERFERQGMRRTVEAVLIVHQHRHPHVLLLQLPSGHFELPGGCLNPGETELEGLKRKVTKKLSTNEVFGPKWEHGELLCMWWRPGFDTEMWPYQVPHITKPKECKKLFVVPLPQRCGFTLPKNIKLVAVPLFELYDNGRHYGPIISSIPQMLGRFNLSYL